MEIMENFANVVLLNDIICIATAAGFEVSTKMGAFGFQRQGASSSYTFNYIYKIITKFHKASFITSNKALYM